MATPTLIEDEIRAWRDVADDDNPAGPLFTSTYAEADLTDETDIITAQCGTNCTASRRYFCC